MMTYADEWKHDPHALRDAFIERMAMTKREKPPVELREFPIGSEIVIEEKKDNVR